jgi:hypothetical protein
MTTDYHPLLAKALAGLDKSTGEARRALYDRARSALLAQLRSVDPPLSEAEITRERLALEEAVRKVEAEAARQMRFTGSPPRIEETPPAAEPPPGERPAPQHHGAERDRLREEAKPPPEPPAPERPNPGPGAAIGPNRPPPRRELSRSRSPALRQATPDQGVRGLRDVVADAETLGEATAQAARTAREAYASSPSGEPSLDRIEPRVEPEGLRGPRRERRPPPRVAEPPAWTTTEPPFPDPPPLEHAAPPEPPGRRRVPGPAPRRAGFDRDVAPANPARRGLIAAAITVLVLAGLAGAGYWQRERVAGWFGSAKDTVSAPEQRQAAQPRPKNDDRVGQDGQPAAPANEPDSRPAVPPPAVAQRVVLYEEDPANPEGHRYVGSALWRTETVSPGPGLAPELAIRGDIEVPERRLAMTMSIRRNTDSALPASHTIEIMFNVPADFPFGGVSNVPGLLMKEQEGARGAPLSGQSVKVTNNYFLIGLSSADADMQRNLQLLKERAWFDIPIVYNNGRRAILAVEKGTPGERAFKEAFAAWEKK